MYYILDEKKRVLPATIIEFANNQRHNFQVKRDLLCKRRGILVSTVFLGLDHRFGSEGDPVVFETMIFGTTLHDYQERYTSWRDAEKGHARALARARQARWTKNRVTRKALKKSMKGARKFLRQMSDRRKQVRIETPSDS